MAPESDPNKEKNIVVIKKIPKVHETEPTEVSNLKTVKGIPGFIDMIDYKTNNYHGFIVMEFPGEEWITLYDFIDEKKPLAFETVRAVFNQVVDCLRRLQVIGYNHNDIKGSM